GGSSSVCLACRCDGRRELHGSAAVVTIAPRPGRAQGTSTAPRTSRLCRYADGGHGPTLRYDAPGRVCQAERMERTNARPHVVIVGGGISGLAAAFFLMNDAVWGTA